MPGTASGNTGKADSGWTRKTLDRAVEDITSLGVFDGAVVEARAVWSSPGKFMIGQIRVAKEPDTFRWIICGDLPTDHVSSGVASTAREALKHFSLKWHLDAARYADPAARRKFGLDETMDWKRMTSQLVAKAEELYELAEDDRLWQHSGRSAPS